ncbi:MAG TPA: SHOCT domain-containing protein [Micromonosporaceae bacterium]
MARTAVVAGTATAVSNRVSRRQQGRWAQQEQQQAYDQQQAYYQQQAYPPQGYQQPAAQPAGGDMTDKIEQLKQLGELKAQGVLTDAEFEAQKQRILGS